MAVDPLRWERRPQLRRPVVIAAFEGWNDAADAASGAGRWLARSVGAQRFATLDPEEFYDFTSTRPQVRLVEGVTRAIDWPTNELAAAALPGTGRDAVFLHGVEPQLKWRTFCEALVGVVTGLGAEMVVTLGALLADVPHTRPVRVTGTAADPGLVASLGLSTSRYEGPTGIVGVLHDACSRAGVASASLWAAVPHYVAPTPSPKATLALVERAAALLGTAVAPVDLQIAAAAYERQVTEMVDSDEDVAAYVRQLEEADDDDEDLDADDLAEQAERFLRDQEGR